MSEFKFVEKKSNLKISFERIAFKFFIFFIISLLFSVKILFLSYNDLPEQKIIKKKKILDLVLLIEKVIFWLNQ